MTLAICLKIIGRVRATKLDGQFYHQSSFVNIVLVKNFPPGVYYLEANQYKIWKTMDKKQFQSTPPHRGDWYGHDG